MEHNSTTTFGQRLKEARRELGISQIELGELLEISDKAVSTYEVGRAQPSLEMLKKICKATKKPITYFDKDFGAYDHSLVTKLENVEQQLVSVQNELKDIKTCLENMLK